MANTVSDLMKAKMADYLITIAGWPAAIANNSLADIEHIYYYQRSSVPPGSDKTMDTTAMERQYYIDVTGASGSIADLERAFYDNKLIAAGTLEDRAYIWWSGVIT